MVQTNTYVLVAGRALPNLSVFFLECFKVEAKEIRNKESIKNKSVNNNDHQTVGRSSACAVSRCAPAAAV